MLKNGDFSNGWEDLHGFPIQEPNDWGVHWIKIGEPLFDSDDLARGIPECVHKLAHQLPPNEQPGAPDALILKGNAVYKVFHYSAPFGIELMQAVTGLAPGAHAKLTVPMRVHRHEDPDPYGAESAVFVNKIGTWVHSGDMGDRQWFRHVVEFIVPDSGLAYISIRMKSKWARAKDFFIDDVTLEIDDTTDPGHQIVLTLPTTPHVHVTVVESPSSDLIIALPKGFTLLQQ